MKERSKDRETAALMGDLLVQLAQHENIKRMLSEMGELPAEDLIQELLDEFEKVVDRRHLEAILSRMSGIRRELSPPIPLPRPAVEADELPPVPKPASPELSRTIQAAPSETLPSQAGPVEPGETRIVEPGGSGALPPKESSISVQSLPSPLPEEEKPRVSLQESTPSAEILHTMRPEAGQSTTAEPPVEKQDVRPGSTKESAAPGSHPVEPSAVSGETEHEETPLQPPKHRHIKIPYEFEDEDYVYLHGVTAIPLGEKAAPKPFMLEEKGIESRDFAFALDYGGMRFYLSKINAKTTNVNKNGVLLLNKQESIQFRGGHQSVLNDLRAHGIVLPFEFGTVALGKDYLLDKIDAHLHELRDALKEMQATKWWNLGVYVLDARIAQFVGPEGLTAQRENERHRRSFQTPAHAGKIDIKVLERVLLKEKKIAEEVHEEVQKVAERSDVDHMVSLGSGTTDDWKMILKSSYEVRPANIAKFNRALNDIQYRHFIYEIMLIPSGDREHFSFRKR